MKKTASKNSELLSLTAYGKRRGFTRQYAAKLRDEGVIVMRGGKVDVKISDAVLDDRPVRSGTTLNQARISELIWRGKLRKLDFDQRSGRLLEREKVEKELFRNNRIIRDSVLTIPDRVAGAVAAEFAAWAEAHGCKSAAANLDMGETHRLIMAECRRALEGAARNLKAEEGEG